MMTDFRCCGDLLIIAAENNAMVDAVRGMIPAFRDYAEQKLAERRPARLCA